MRYTVETVTPAQIAGVIDHSMLRPEMTTAEVLAGCEVATRFRTASVCCRPIDVASCARFLQGSGVPVGTVIGFPHGSVPTATKVYESQLAIDAGAVELDMVIAIGKLRADEVEYVLDDIAAVVEVAGDRAIVKVIVENALLDDAHKRIGCELAERAGAGYVKTSTGYASSGATVPDVELMRATVGPAVKVKAAGGIRTLDELLAMVNAGADRCGASATESIMEELRRRQAG